MGRIYAETLTKSYLKSCGVTHVSEDGKVFKGNKEITQHLNNSGHMVVMLYDPLRRAAVPPAERTNSTGAIYLPVHRIVFAWCHNEVPTGLVVDHINNNKVDNRIENLQLLTPGENIWKERVCNVRELSCMLTRPREYYENKLAKYEKLYKLAKETHNMEEAHKQRSNISNIRAKLRYYDNHKGETI